MDVREAAIPDQLQTIRPGERVYVKVFKRKWDQPRCEGPFKVILATPTALKIEGKNVWFHLNHYCRADNSERTLEAYRRRAHPGREGEGDKALQEARKSQSLQGERRSQRLAARRASSSTTSSGSLAARKESGSDTDDDLTGPAESQGEQESPRGRAIRIIRGKKPKQWDCGELGQ